MELKPEKNSGLNEIRTNDHYDTDSRFRSNMISIKYVTERQELVHNGL